MGGTRRQVPNDPLRRQRILDGALDAVAEHGVHRTTHRRIAACAEVPLGSLTYYFDGLDDILEQAFARLADGMSRNYRAALGEATTTSEACAAVVDLICGPEYATARRMTLIFEMYSYANHNRAVAETARTWLDRSQDSLALHFPPHVCAALDALVEGWPMHQTFRRAPLNRALVHATITAIAAMAPPEAT
ncbi:TetR/AcrR family transcriptional regulator [Prauserella cavernicola]|uniref:TetR family transcriptional regulator n=1 Tax=Prauserella cavernicola TaxID=2800127 RepID=A0A934QPG9_9PSEU|nr:TetR family transcriptional regulator [Prauserella cavernicola]MBK1783648.1 TetR family transcriptional regulator [Prauserella cavernicola]